MPRLLTVQDRGVVWLLTLNSTARLVSAQQLITAAESANFDRLGSALASLRHYGRSETAHLRVVVGSPLQDTAASDAGRVYVYKLGLSLVPRLASSISWTVSTVANTGSGSTSGCQLQAAVTVGHSPTSLSHAYNVSVSITSLTVGTITSRAGVFTASVNRSSLSCADAASGAVTLYSTAPGWSSTAIALAPQLQLAQTGSPSTSLMHGPAISAGDWGSAPGMLRGSFTVVFNVDLNFAVKKLDSISGSVALTYFTSVGSGGSTTSTVSSSTDFTLPLNRSTNTAPSFVSTKWNQSAAFSYQHVVGWSSNDWPALQIADWSIQDPDFDVSPTDPVVTGGELSLMQLSVSAVNGTVSMTSSEGLNVIAGSMGSASVTVKGSLIDINAALSTLRYQPSYELTLRSGSVTLTADDLGNSGAGVAKQASIVLSVQITRPIASLTLSGTGSAVYTGLEDNPVALSATPVILSVAVAGSETSPNNVSLNVLASAGFLNLTSVPAGVAVTSTSATNATVICAASSLASALAGIQVAPPLNWNYPANGFISVLLRLSQNGATLGSTVSVLLSLEAVNDLPSLSLPANGSIAVTSGSKYYFAASDFALLDVDSDESGVSAELTLSVQSSLGLLQLNASSTMVGLRLVNVSVDVAVSSLVLYGSKDALTRSLSYLVYHAPVTGTSNVSCLLYTSPSPRD